MSFDGIIPAVQSGSVDIGIAAFTVNEERAKVIDFSHQYELSEQLLIVKKGDAGVSTNPQKASGRNPQKASARK